MATRAGVGVLKNVSAECYPPGGLCILLWLCKLLSFHISIRLVRKQQKAEEAGILQQKTIRILRIFTRNFPVFYYIFKPQLCLSFQTLSISNKES